MNIIDIEKIVQLVEQKLKASIMSYRLHLVQILSNYCSDDKSGHFYREGVGEDFLFAKINKRIC